MYRLELEHHFDAAHHLNDYDGACANMHGHHWLVKVNIHGSELSSNGMLVDFKEIKKIIDVLDHCNINESVYFNPTAENLAKYLKETLQAYCNKLTHLPTVESIQIFESPGASIAY